MCKEWKDIKSHPNYKISDHGDVTNKNTGLELKPIYDKRTGYYKVGLWKNNVGTTRSIHRLVAEAFLNPQEGLDVNHIDGNKLNNHVSNLEFVTRSRNLQHAYDNGLNPRSRSVRIVETGEIFNSVTECARHIGSCHQNICKCLNKNDRIHHSCKGFHFEYID